MRAWNARWASSPTRVSDPGASSAIAQASASLRVARSSGLRPLILARTARRSARPPTRSVQARSPFVLRIVTSSAGEAFVVSQSVMAFFTTGTPLTGSRPRSSTTNAKPRLGS